MWILVSNGWVIFCFEILLDYFNLKLYIMCGVIFLLVHQFFRVCISVKYYLE